MLLYENIKRLRLKNGLTQQELAELAGYSDKSMIAKIEKGVVDLSLSKIRDFADVLHTTPSSLLGWETVGETTLRTIPLYGSIPAGSPNITNNEADEMVPYERTGSYYALRIKGNSMEPTIMDGDIVYVHEQSSVNDGEIAIVSVGIYEGTCKEVRVFKNGIMLIGHNREAYTPRFYTADEVASLPVVIQGKVVEVRRML